MMFPLTWKIWRIRIVERWQGRGSKAGRRWVMSLLVFLLMVVTVCPVISFIFLRVPCLSTFCLWVGQRMVWHAPGGEGLHHTHAALSLTFQILFSVLDSRHGGSTKTQGITCYIKTPHQCVTPHDSSALETKENPWTKQAKRVLRTCTATSRPIQSIL